METNYLIAKRRMGRGVVTLKLVGSFYLPLEGFVKQKGIRFIPKNSWSRPLASALATPRLIKTF